MDNKNFYIAIVVTLILVGGGLYYLKSIQPEKNDNKEFNVESMEDLQKLMEENQIQTVAPTPQVEDSNEPSESMNYDQIENIEGNEYYLFVGASCPHCKEVEGFIEENDLKDKVGIKVVEVFDDVANQKYYVQAKEKCNEEVDAISVPFMYKDGQCFSGPSEAEVELKQVTEIQ